ncbi:alpha/beta hydrolase [Pseudomonas sp. DTU_2021_1001937_2_SI_NGA_ILE_001]|uniref:alpha/beta fold hydrolase n=1 Tax=Pseudomonas sp. DTU_2021_1001937_2_SI_NGA_ILE_001 TaxID=3077589 RepID=UPI0028FC0D61|nr:alpha/beta hydrolase [Pseudomonas sp. DTU_2021_1001937_2_SI_NGA_ILE_001]WNW13871.1 alpha/beta hydrolase [Pseudomonas sp. DTU_2021_1001937_2_SI_NGA_ILE_001]
MNVPRFSSVVHAVLARLKPGGVRCLLAALTGVSMTLALLPPAAQADAPPIRNIVLVHGAFVDGSSWQRVVPELARLGYHVTAVQNPLTSLEDDVRATQRVLERQHGDVLLVGHSWGGAVITQAGNAPNVKGLVYLSALAPDSGESVDDLLHRLKAPMTGLTPDAHGLVWLDDPDAFHEVMGNDLSKELAHSLAALQQPIAVAAFTGKVRHAAWRDKPSWYLRTGQDHALRPEVQQAIAQHINAQVRSIESSHLSMLSHPRDVVVLLDEAARQAGADQRSTTPNR